MQINRTDLINLQRAVAAKSLSEFIRMAWQQLEIGITYRDGWHIDAMSEHLQAVASGEITRLVINVPPGTMKSSTVCVFFPAWLWGPHGKPNRRFIGASHELTNATRDNRNTRRLVESEWFQERWPITLIKNTDNLFENTSRGFRQSVPVASMTGKRGHVVAWDDPLSPENANSAADRKSVLRILTETLPGRFVNPISSGFILVMQRLHQDDPSGYVLANDLGYEHLMLPMEFEPGRRCRTKIGFVDPRTEEGELLAPDRFPRHVVERDKKVMGQYGTAGQFQQRPAPRDGGLFKRSDFEIIGAAPPGCRWVRGWDVAASVQATSAFTAGVRMGVTPSGEYIIDDVTRGQWSSGAVETTIRNVASQDASQYPGIRGSIPQDPGAGGKAWAIAIVKAAAGFDYHKSPENGDKVTRARPLAAQVEIGNVKLVNGPWVKDFLDEAELFPNGTFKDQVDAASRAFGVLSTSVPFEWFVGGETHQ